MGFVQSGMFGSDRGSTPKATNKKHITNSNQRDLITQKFPALTYCYIHFIIDYLNTEARVGL